MQALETKRRMAAFNQIFGTMSPQEFKIEPPVFSEFVRSKDYLNMPPLTSHQRIVFEESLGEDPRMVFDPSKVINEIVLLWGKGSGKDLISSYVIAWMAYIVCCLHDPNSYLGLPPDESIDIINVAASQTQAKIVFFAKLKARLRSECFEQFGIEVLEARAHFPNYNNLRLFSLHSRQETYEGMNILAWVMDEASAFRDKRDRSNAEMVYRTLRTSSRSRFLERWKGFILSYPRRPRDFTIRAYEASKTTPSMYGNKASTWEVLAPLRTEADFKADYDKDPIGSALVYQCDVSAVVGAFIKDRQAIRDCIYDHPQLLASEEKEVRREVADSGILRRFVAKELTWADQSDQALARVYWMHGDPSLAGDFGVVMGHRGEREDEHNKYRVVIDGILTWQARPDTRVDIINVTNIMMELAQIYDMEQVTFDQWNSAFSIQRMLDAGINAADLSFSAKMQRAMYRNLRSMIYNDMIEYPNHPVLLRELDELVSDGRRVDRPEGGTKDVTDCVAVIAWYASGADNPQPLRTGQTTMLGSIGEILGQEPVGALWGGVY